MPSIVEILLTLLLITLVVLTLIQLVGLVVAAWLHLFKSKRLSEARVEKSDGSDHSG